MGQVDGAQEPFCWRELMPPKIGMIGALKEAVIIVGRNTLDPLMPRVHHGTPKREKLGTKIHLSPLEVVIKATSSFANR